MIRGLVIATCMFLSSPGAITASADEVTPVETSQTDAPQHFVRPGTSLNARSGPGTDYDVVQTLPTGTGVRELAREGEWSRVTLPADQVGWVHNGFLVDRMSRDTRDIDWTAARATTLVSEVNADDRWDFDMSADGRVIGYERNGNEVWLTLAGERVDMRLDGGGLSSLRSVSVTDDGSWLTASDAEGRVLVWNTSSGERIVHLDTGRGRVYNAEYAPGAQRLFTSHRCAGRCDGPSSAVLWDSRSGEAIRSVDVSENVRRAYFSPSEDSIFILAFSRNPFLVRMNAEDGSEQYVMKLDHNPKSLSFLPGGRQVLLQLAFGAEIFDADSGAVLAALPDFGGRGVVSAGLSPDGDAIISSFTNNLVRVWDADTGKNEMLRLEHPDGKPVNSAEYSPDGHRIISGSRGGMVRIWDAETGALTAEKRASDADIAKVRFLGDGSGFLSVSRNGTIKLWQP